MIEANRDQRGWVINLTTPGSLDLTITIPKAFDNNSEDSSNGRVDPNSTCKKVRNGLNPRHLSTPNRYFS